MLVVEGSKKFLPAINKINFQSKPDVQYKSELTLCPTNNQDIAKLSPNNLKAYYIPFTGQTKKNEVEDQFISEFKQALTNNAKEILENAIKIAKENKAPEINESHMALSALLNLKEFIEKSDDVTKEIPGLLARNLDANPDYLKDEQTKKALTELVDKHIEALDKDIKSQPQAEKLPSPIKLNIELEESIQDVYREVIKSLGEFSEDTFPIVNEGVLINPISGSQKDTFAVKTLKEVGTNIDKICPLAHTQDLLDQKKALSAPEFYKSTAKLIDTLLTTSKNILLSYEQGSMPGMVALSYGEIIKNRTFGKINADNTKCFMLDLSGIENPVSHLMQLASAVKKDPEKHEVYFVRDFNRIIGEEVGVLLIKSLQNIPNFHIVGLMDAKIQRSINTESSNLTDIIIKNSLQQGFEQIKLIPPSAEQTTKMLLNGFQTEGLTNKFSKNSIKETVDLALQRKGAFPGKAIDLLKMIDNYYVNKGKAPVTIGEVQVKKFAAINPELFKESRSNLSGYEVIYKTGKTLDDFVSTKETKDKAKEIVDYINKGHKGCKGFVFDSPQGNGRRLFAEAIAGQAKVPLIPVNAMDFRVQSKEQSIFEMEHLFKTAVEQANANEKKTAIIFIDQFENIAKHPELAYYMHDLEAKQACNVMLEKMDGLNRDKNAKNVNIIIMASHNYESEFLDPNIYKPKRFDDTIFLPSSKRNVDLRYQILDHYIKKDKIKIAGETKEDKQKLIKDFAETTEGFGPDDLINLLEKAKNIAKSNKNNEIGMEAFRDAQLRLIAGNVTRTDYPVWSNKILSEHEGGHALAETVMYNVIKKHKNPWHLPSKVDFITLDPRGYFLGAVFPKESENKTEANLETVFSHLVFGYGGYAAEKAFYGIDGSTGITQDIRQNSQMAKTMVTVAGMGPKTGKISCAGDPDLMAMKIKEISEDIDLLLNNTKLVSEVVIETYKGFLSEFADKYKDLAGTGKCCLSGKEFEKQMEDWANRDESSKGGKTSEQKKADIKLLEETILKAMEATKKGLKISRKEK